MLTQRLLVTIVLLPAGILVIHLGGLYLATFIVLFMGLASWEYTRLFHAGGLQPSGILAVAGCVLLIYGRWYDGFNSTPWIVSALILVSITYHLVAFERGRQLAASDFAVTLSGALYVGWLGAFLVSMRALPDGEWWVLTVLCGVWFADSGAYSIGTRYGRHLLSPRLSPKKTWEGYLGGVVAGTLAGALFGFIWGLGASPGSAVTAWSGAVLGFLMGLITPLGDLGESMVKRQVGVKDSGTIFPGHGGAFDRVDSWLWAAVIGYFVIVWFF
jgi:phosphatidate cytidylyltransferase